MSNITRNEIEIAIADYLLKGGKIKKLSPSRKKNFFWGMGIREFENPHERADIFLEKILDSIEVDFFETEERYDILLAEYEK